MAIVYPGAIDSFSVPTLPEDTSLSSAGTSTRDHTQSHADLGLAVMALEANASPLEHDHSDGATENPLWATDQLLQVNTHQSPDTNAGLESLHHTLGTGPTEAAAGNHAHDYEGPSIFNKPFALCTSTTRPTNPPVGMLIYETDTNIARSWTSFAANVLTGLPAANFLYDFNTDNNASSLDPTIFSQTYPIGSSPADGVMASPNAENAIWTRGANVTCRCIARAVQSTYAVTASDDQILTFYTGTTQLQSRDTILFVFPNIENPSPSNDAYLRMSADGLSYVRFSLTDAGCAFSYTVSGPSGEVFLGGVRTGITDAINTTWTAKAIGNSYILYVNGQQALAFYDNDNLVSVGQNFRGWGIGMMAAQGQHGSQLIPNNLLAVSIADNTAIPGYSSELIWQLLNFGVVPHLRAETHYAQVLVPSVRHVVAFDFIVFDWHYKRFIEVETSETDITIQEPGHYSVHASVSWDPTYPLFDAALLEVTVNGADIGRKQYQFERGNGFFPGFPQTMDLFFTYHFALGDVVRVECLTNAPAPVRLFYRADSPNIQSCWVELDFIGP